MTHDFHFYVTFMCARNAGFDANTSIQIALCADGVDGGEPEFIRKSKGKYKQVKHEGKKWFPITVYRTFSSVNSQHSLGASIAPVPWMAFHFLPSLEVDSKTNPYYIRKIDRNLPKRKSSAPDHPRFRMHELNTARDLESGLICGKSSRFAKKLIKDTAQFAKTWGGKKTLPIHAAAMLGIRSHVIADLFAHEGFAGCRSVAINALNHANSLTKPRKLNYSLESPKGASFVKTMRIGRLGHGQAGQRPDEPFLNYRFQRKIDGRTFIKDNYDIFGEALMTVTQVLKGEMPSQYKNWKKLEIDYKYKWVDIRDGMNASRKERVKFLANFIYKNETSEAQKKIWRYMLKDYHDRSDYWCFNIMKDPKLSEYFSMAADDHLRWFHETFFELARVGIDQYMDVSVLWPWTSSDDRKGQEYTKNLLAGGEVHIGNTDRNITGLQIGTQYMERYEGGDLKPSRVYSDLRYKVFKQV